MALLSLGAFVGATTAAEPQPPLGAADVESASIQALGPGEPDDVPVVAAACPAFHWGISAEETPAAIELRVSRLAEATDELEARPVLERRLPGPSRLWTPYVGDCLERGGVYAWWVRTLDRTGEPGPWSETRVFQVLERPETAGGEASLPAGVPTAETREAPGVDSGSEGSPRRPGARRDSARTESAASLAGATVAISGKRSETSGNAIGVVGETASPDGAGVAAANADPGGGPDLLLDGAAQGATDTILTESGLDRSSAGAEVFEFGNSGAGSLTLRVDGADLVTTLTDQDTLGGLGCASGDLPESDGGGGWGCLASAAFAPALHAHDDRYFTETEMGDSGSAALHWDNLTTVPAGFADGVDDDTTYSAGDGMVLSGTTLAGGPEVLYSPGVLPRDNQISPLVDTGGNTCEDALSVAIRPDGLPVVACAASDRSLLVGTCIDRSCSDIGDFGGMSGVTVGSNTSTVVRPDLSSLTVFSDAGDLAVFDSAGGGGSLGVLGEQASVALGPDGLPIVTFAFGSSEIGFLDCDDALCSSFTRTDIDISSVDSGNVTHTAVALAPGGFPVVAFQSAGQTGFVECGDAACISSVIPHSVGHAGFATDHPLSLVVDEEGRPVTLLCSKNSPEDGVHLVIPGVSTPNLDSVGTHAAVTVAGDGRLVVAYWDEGNGHLKYARCHDEDCTTWSNLAVDPASGTTGNVGSHVALSSGGDGRPLAVYIDDGSVFSTARALKCANSFCVPFFQRR